ncbi:hypothetical protein [uncultured Kiloniella sp.]|uniref:hypothetical protein n=1 Tax=uncultured Kiloniella sp. TaxID=1133091 RepID=UPI00260E334F|nr:hypothetical protein [uncultured Kiloniella sp.]
MLSKLRVLTLIVAVSILATNGVLAQQYKAPSTIEKKEKAPIKDGAKNFIEAFYGKCYAYIDSLDRIRSLAVVLKWRPLNKDQWGFLGPMEGEKGELAVGDSGQFCYSRIFDSLSQGLENNKLYKTVKKKKKAFLTFNKDAKSQLGLEKIEIEFKETIGAKTTLGEAQNLKLFLTNKAEPVLLKLVKFEKNPKLTKKHFQFETPKNTNITQMK